MATTSTPNKTRVNLIPRNTTNAAGGLTRSNAFPAGFGGRAKGRIINGGTGPTIAGYIDLFGTSTADGSAPSNPPGTGSIGDDWFFIGRLFGAGVAANGRYDLQNVVVGPDVQYICAEANGNTGQSVTVEAWFDAVPSITGT